MVCDDPKTIALFFVALKVRKFSYTELATYLAASDNMLTRWSIACAGTWA